MAWDALGRTRVWSVRLAVVVAASATVLNAALAHAESTTLHSGVQAYRGSAGHAGAFTSVGPRALGLAWYVAADADVSASVAVATDGAVFSVSIDGVVRALASSGQERWKKSIGTKTNGSPVLTPDGQRVIIGDQRGRVRALSSTDGNGDWTSASYGQVIGSVVIAPAGRIWFLAIDNRLIGLEADGSEFAVISLPALGIDTPALTSTGVIVVATADAKLRRYSPNGDPTFETSLPYAPTTGPIVGPDDAVTVGVDTEIIRTDATSPAIRWRKSVGVTVRSTPAVGRDGTTVFGTTDGRVIALDPDGNIKWSDKTGGSVISAPAIDARGSVYIGSGDATLYAYDASGKRFATYRAFDAITSPVTIGTDGTVYAGSLDNRLYALRDSTRRFASSPADRVGGDLVRELASGKVFIMIDGTRRHVPDPLTLARLGMGSRPVSNATADELDRNPQGPALPSLRDGALIQSSTGAVYLVDEGTRQWLPAGDPSAQPVADQIIRTLPVNTSDGLLVKGVDPKVYVIEGGSRRWVSSAAVFATRGYSWSAVHLVTETALGSIPIGSPIVE